MRVLILIAGILSTLLPLTSATLEKLSIDQMIEQSSAIARVKVINSHAERRGAVIYTFSEVKVLEQWKGDEQTTIEVAVPGGAVAGYRQDFSGAPSLKKDTEYVLFLWTSKSGINHVIGLSQGVFTLSVDEKGQVIVHRGATVEVMLDPENGEPVQDKALTFGIGDLRDHVERTLNKSRRK